MFINVVVVGDSCCRTGGVGRNLRSSQELDKEGFSSSKIGLLGRGLERAIAWRAQREISSAVCDGEVCFSFLSRDLQRDV